MKVILRKRLDHVLCSRSLVVLACSVLQGYEGTASDHLPVVATVRLRESGEAEQQLGPTPSLLFWAVSLGNLSLRHDSRAR